MTDGETVITYAYDGDGNRIRKTVNGETTEYEYIDGKLLSLQKGQDKLQFLYDETDKVYGFLYNGDVCYYVFNLQGDITGIRKADGWDVASYSYDAWGNPTGIYDDNTTLSTLNPFRYRGYFYDEETGFYFLQSRYYDPEVGRFISADSIAGANRDIVSYNLFAYCSNNPVNKADITGMAAIIDDVVIGIVIVCIFLVEYAAVMAATTDWTIGNNALQIPDVSISKIPLPPQNTSPDSGKEPFPFPPYSHDNKSDSNKGKYYEVMRMGKGSGIIIFLQDDFDLLEAMVRVRNGLDVWTSNEADARLLALRASGGYIFHEAKDGDCAHYHLKNKAYGAHCFFGTEGIFDMVGCC